MRPASVRSTNLAGRPDSAYHGAISDYLGIVTRRAPAGGRCEIRQAGGGRSGTIRYQDSYPGAFGPIPMLRKWLPRDYFDPVDMLNFTDTKIVDADLCQLYELPEVESLLLGGTQIGDGGMAHLQRLEQLHELHLDRTQVSDAGLAQVARITRLEYLLLSGTQVTDSGLAQIGGLTQLKWLDVSDTHVTDFGVGPCNEVQRIGKDIAGWHARVGQGTRSSPRAREFDFDFSE